MADPRFFKKRKPLSVGEIALLTGAKLRDSSMESVMISDVASISTAKQGEISFVENRRYASQITSSEASACFLTEDLLSRIPAHMIPLLTKSPRRDFAKLSQLFYEKESKTPKISSKSVVSKTCVIGEGCRIDPGVIVGEFCEIGKDCWIGSNTVIDDGVKIGDRTRIGTNVSISHSEVGVDCFIYPGVRIGQPGFGFEVDAAGPIEMPQLGRVIIGDNVEIGANTTIDRGAGPDTEIGDFTRIDNLVQIGHNVKIGKGCIIVAQVGISGSTEIGDKSIIGGQAGLAGHLKIGKQVKIAAQSGVTRNLNDGSIVGGAPAVPIGDFRRQVASIKSLGRRHVRRE